MRRSVPSSLASSLAPSPLAQVGLGAASRSPLALALGLALPLELAACGAPEPASKPASAPAASASAPTTPTAPTATVAPSSEPTAAPAEPPSRWAKCEAPPKGMVCIPGGDAVVGDDAGAARERPRHVVEVSTFYVDKHEVTNREYEACEKAKACKDRIPPDKTFLAPDQPAVPLTWNMAHAYCVWAGKRLLTEAEWEKVARGGQEARVYPWGSAPPTCERGQFQGCAPGTTKSVGSFPAGPYGVFDMAGNGYEWVHDWASDCFGGCKSPCGDACLGTDPQGPCGGASQCKGSTMKILKGGSWFWPGESGRGAHRRPEKPESGMHRLSVRCASTRPTLATWPPLALTDPPAAPASPTPPSREELTRFRAVVEDLDVAKIKHCSRSGDARHDCRDPHSYVFTNEPEQSLFAPFVKNKGKAFVGLGADQAYGFVAAAKSEWAWLFDYDPAVVRVHYMIRAVALASPTREDFVRHFTEGMAKTTTELLKKALAEPVYAGSRPLDPAEQAATVESFRIARSALHDHFKRHARPSPGVKSNEFSWLRADESYLYIRTLYQQGRILAVKGNLLTAVALPSIAKAAKSLGTTVRVYYTSNADDQWSITDAYRRNFVGMPFDAETVWAHTVLPRGKVHKTGEWVYVVHDGLDAQARLKSAGWEMLHWLGSEGMRRDPKHLITIGLPAKTEREAPTK